MSPSNPALFLTYLVLSPLYYWQNFQESWKQFLGFRIVLDKIHFSPGSKTILKNCSYAFKEELLANRTMKKIDSSTSGKVFEKLLNVSFFGLENCAFRDLYEQLFRSKTIFNIYSDSVFQAEQEYVLSQSLSRYWSPEIQFYENHGKKTGFLKTWSFFDFSNWRKHRNNLKNIYSWSP